jgi:Uma2 family endonuclease
MFWAVREPPLQKGNVMGLPAEKIYLTADEFLAWEIEQPERWELVDGECFAMAGGTDIHNTICLNVAFALRASLAGRRCSVFMSDVKLKIAEDEAVFYPDVIVSCDDADRGRRQWKEAPVLIAEVLSPSTEAYDRGRKFSSYRLIPGLTTVLFLNQNRPFVECYTRVEGNEWRLTEARDAESVVALEALGFSLPLADLYRDLPEENNP